MKQKLNQLDPLLNRLLAARTNYPSPILDSGLTNEEKIELIAHHFSEIMKVLGVDLNDSSLAKTPLRIARMYVNEIFSGTALENFPEITYMPEPSCSGNKSSFILIKDIRFTSFCEHHFVPMEGYAHVAYVPNQQIIGLSKINRIVEYFSKRPQIQERLTAQIADSLSIVLNSPDIAVVTFAKHACVSHRGVEDCHSSAIVPFLRGVFNNEKEIRKEFFELIKAV